MKNVETELRRIRLQMKHGRWEGVEEKLQKMLMEHRGTGDEISILQAYALEYLPSAGLHEQAIPELERILALEASQAVKERAHELLTDFRAKAAIVPAIVDLSKHAFVECIEFIRSEESLRFHAAGLSADEYEVIKDVDTAKRMAWHQGIEPPFMPWNSLREKSSAGHYVYAQDWKIDTAPLDAFYGEISRICERKLSMPMMEFYDDVCGDLCEILLGKALGVLPDLYEKMWFAYRSDVFPCGWKGRYPNGRLCVYIP